MLKFLVKNQEIEILEREIIAADQIAFVTLKFVFDGDWKKFHKVVQFSQCDETYNLVLGTDGNSCLLPAELHEGAVKMSVFGYDAENTSGLRATTVPITLHIRPSGFVGDGSTPIPPTPDLYQQLLDKMAQGVDGKSAYEIAKEHGYSGTEEQWLASLKGETGATGKTGKKGADGSVRSLLYNEIYAGDLRRQKTHTPDPISKTKIKNNGELPQYYYSDCHEAIVDRDTYEKVKIEIERRNSLAHPVYFFTGIIRCECCGSYYSRRKQRDKNNKIYIRWSCRRKLDKKDCKSVNINESTLISACIETIGEDYEDKINSVIVKENGDIGFSLMGGEYKIWYNPPKPIKPIKAKKEYIRPKHLFDGMIFCGICGRKYGRVISERKGNPLYWRCRSKCVGNETCENVNYPDTEIKEIFCKLFDLPSFDEVKFKNMVTKIIVQKTGSLDFYTTDDKILHYETLKLRENICDSTCTAAFETKVLCAHCGNDYTKYTLKGKFTYWVCRGKRLTHVNCNAGNFSDYQLRKVSAYMLDMDEFEEDIFMKKVNYILAFTDGSLEYHFKDGSKKKWQRT